MADYIDEALLPPAPYGDNQQAILGTTARRDKVILRGWWTEEENIAWFCAQFGDTPPAACSAKTVAIDGTTVGRVVWHGPDSLWLILAQDQTLEHWFAQWQASINQQYISLIPVTHYYHTFSLHGPRALDCLCQGSAFDWRNLAQGHGAVFTVFYNSTILVEHPQDEHYLVTVRASHAAYLWQHLCLAVDSLSAITGHAV